MESGDREKPMNRFYNVNLAAPEPELERRRGGKLSPIVYAGRQA